MLNRHITNTRQYLFYGLIILAPLSKFPYFPLPLYEFSSFRIGFYQLISIFFVAISLPYLYQNSRAVFGDKKTLIALGGILAAIAIGLVSAINVERGLLLSVSLVFLLTVVFATKEYVMSIDSKKLFARLLRPILLMGIVYGIISVLQLLVVTVSDSNALLCAGCTDAVFGFSRINGFSAEPLFWANALLPFFVVSLYALKVKYSRLALASLVGTSLAIGLTFARGAYAAVGAALVVYLAVQYKSRTLTRKSIYRTIGPIVGAFMIAWILLIGSATIRYSDAQYIVYNTFRGMVDHVTLGVIDLPEKTENIPAETTVELQKTNEDSFISAGLVVASQNDRLESAKYALKALTSNMRTFLFGVGLGNLGPYVSYNVYGDAPSNLTVYIFYVLFVSEMGVVGLGALLYLFGSTIRRLIQSSDTASIVVAVTLIAFLVQYFFFGSYINVVYIWVWLGVGMGAQGAQGSQSGKEEVVSRKVASRRVGKWTSSE